MTKSYYQLKKHLTRDIPIESTDDAIKRGVNVQTTFLTKGEKKRKDDGDIESSNNIELDRVTDYREEYEYAKRMGFVK